MLKAHQACIDLQKNVLRIQGREVKFLAEHELPDKARIMDAGEPSASTSTPGAGPSSTPARAPEHFPGSGNTLGTPPSRGAVGTPGRGAGRGRGAGQQFPESSIETLMSLGATREQAIRSLEATGGNLDFAASTLFM
ncbi:hypothetical protein JAAARDRAFT_218078 [Jaapia argillacea MUCL 33604]|uniref:UBA domain-containing protein n=1 Tax=Jaapia argillacea MUCL 33604 TaxID=933084 RepID=A0A067QKX0_9AGAM|nr:hypothetical protein JAAARDRAFT_218078 [Jaapia argillacea MUCL 33604]